MSDLIEQIAVFFDSEAEGILEGYNPVELRSLEECFLDHIEQTFGSSSKSNDWVLDEVSTAFKELAKVAAEDIRKDGYTYPRDFWFMILSRYNLEL